MLTTKQTTYNFTSNLRGKSKTAEHLIRMIDKNSRNSDKIVGDFLLGLIKKKEEEIN